MVVKKTPSKKVPAKRTAGATTSGRSRAGGSAKKAPAKKPPAKAVAPRRRGGRPTSPDPRLLQVLELKRNGKSYAEIAKQLKYSSPQLAFRAFEQAMQMLTVTSVANDRLLQLERLNQLQVALWPDATAGDPKALDLLLKVMDQAAAIPAPLDNRPERARGPVEEATEKEIKDLASHAPALAAAVLVLARNVDDNARDPKAAANAARELRISMTQLRGLAGTKPHADQDPDTPKRRTGKKAAGEVVVPESRLAQLRKQVDSGPRAT